MEAGKDIAVPKAKRPIEGGTKARATTRSCVQAVLSQSAASEVTTASTPVEAESIERISDSDYRSYRTPCHALEELRGDWVCGSAGG